MNSYNNLLSPFTFGGITVKNRIEFPPAVPCLASPHGFVTKDLIEWTRGLAKSGVGIVTIGDTPIDFEYAKDHEHALNLGDDRVIAGLSVLVETIHRYGAKASIELNHGGRFSPPRLLEGRTPLAPSPFPSGTEILLAELEGKKLDYVPTVMTQEHINNAVEHFAEAVYRCMRAGMEMVMIHGAHGHLIGQFLSPFTNKRNDRYGGSLQNRARFPIEVLDSIRKKVGDRIAIEYRISAEELVEGGMSVEETLEFAKMIQDKIDLLHVSVGLLPEPQTIPSMIQPTYFPHGMNVHYAERFKKELNVPVTTVGSITLEMAEDIIAQDRADMVAMARPILADPDYVKKVLQGEADKIRPCVRCNTCTNRSALFLPVRCAVNPVNGREEEFKNTPAPTKTKKVVVAGGGPAGMEAARTAAERGHKVVLLEKESHLGGALIPASAAPFKADMKDYLDWAVRMTMNTSGLTVKLNTEASDRNILDEKPDVLVVAVGAEPIFPEIPCANDSGIVWAGDVLMNKAELGETVLVTGAGLTGCESALHLAGQGKNVTLIDMLPASRIAAEVPLINMMALRGMLAEKKVNIITEVKLESVGDKGAVVIDKNWQRTEIPCDNVVLSTGVKPRAETVSKLDHLAPEVFVIGDCAFKRGNLCRATTSGFNAAMDI